MARRFSGYFANFVTTGDPNGGDLPTWPMFDPAAFDLMHFTLDDGPVFGPDPRAARVKLIERVGRHGSAARSFLDALAATRRSEISAARALVLIGVGSECILARR
jgi:Carboxylesterase family